MITIIDFVSQVVILAQNKSVQEVLKSSSLDVKTVAEVAPVEVHPGLTKLKKERVNVE